MKKIAFICIALLITASMVSAQDFAPTPLRINAQPVVNYDFDGSEIDIPINITGHDCSAVLLIYTKDQGPAIGEVMNGYLGWHYVNGVDTSIYISEPVSLLAGDNTLTWSGLDDDEGIVPPGEYTYYVWAFDNISPKSLASEAIHDSGIAGGITLVEYDTAGQPMANPWIVCHRWYYNADGANVYDLNTQVKWTLGGSPTDMDLVESTACSIADTYVYDKLISFDPTDFEYFYQSGGLNRAEGTWKGTWRMKWIPNGEAELQTDWGDAGFAGVAQLHEANMGPIAYGEKVYYVNQNYHGYNNDNAESQLLIIDNGSGTVEEILDLTDWWSDIEDFEAGGQINAGPNQMFLRNGYLFLNAHGTCIKQMVDPTAEDMEDFYLWTNQNGDYFLDHHFAEDSDKPWVCNDYRVGPFMYTISADDNYFSAVPPFDIGAVSFGLLAPDGDAVDYMAFANETAGWKKFVYFIDNGSAFDGIYCDNDAASYDPDNPFASVFTPGVFYIAQDSVKGIITSQPEAVDADAPAAFTVAQNSPNPFNPTTSISFNLAEAGQVQIDVYNVSGQKVDTIANEVLTSGNHSVTWDASGFSAGVYFYTVKSGDFSKTMKMTLLK